ncbi:hypothetical protein C9446_15170 [Providencia heimbachae]|nr:hypothetical protein C9446_15170 [Providencia heimbachae]
MLPKPSSFTALPQRELFREYFFIIFYTVTALTTFVNPSHILVYAPQDVFVYRLATTRTI